MIFHHSRVDAGQLGARLFEAYAGSEAAEEFGHAMHAAGNHSGGEMVGAAGDVANDLSFGGIRNGGFENADDQARSITKAAEANGFADDGRILLHHRGPEAIGEDGGTGGFGAVVTHVEEASEHGVQAHDFEVGAADNATSDCAGVTEVVHGETNGREVAKLANGFGTGANVLDLRDGEGCVIGADAFGALPDVDEAVLVAVDERTEEHAAHQAEDGGGGADAEGEGEDDCESEALGARERAESCLQIVKDQRGCKAHHPISLNRSGLPIAIIDSPIVFWSFFTSVSTACLGPCLGD